MPHDGGDPGSISFFLHVSICLLDIEHLWVD